MMRAVAYAAAAANAVTGGALFAFSALVMPALRRTTDDEATATMRSINRVAERSVTVLAPLMVGGLAAIAVAVWAIRGDHDGSSRGLLLAGSLAGVAALVITAAFHVPRNDALMRGSLAWRDYVGPWTAMNHVRSLAALAAAGLIIAGLHSS